jgi:hemoglobin-like flavoprotein
MTPGQVELLQRSFKVIGPNDARLAHSFYAKLFELEPETRVVFAGETELQWRKLTAVFKALVKHEVRSMLTLPVTKSGSREVLIAGVGELAERYARKGGRPEHLPAVKEALLWSLDRHLGEAFDQKTAEAWMWACEVIAESMARVMKAEAVAPSLPDDHGRPVPASNKDSLELLFSH